MSSDVQAKWMNSAARAISGTSAKRSFSQYSTALTSWLVVRSMALTRSASATPKSRAVCESFWRVAALKAETSTIPGSSASASSQRELDAHALADQRVFAEMLSECCDLAAIAAIERRQRCKGGKRLGDRHRADDFR